MLLEIFSDAGREQIKRQESFLQVLIWILFTEVEFMMDSTECLAHLKLSAL